MTRAPPLSAGRITMSLLIFFIKSFKAVLSSGERLSLSVRCGIRAMWLVMEGHNSLRCRFTPASGIHALYGLRFDTEF